MAPGGLPIFQFAYVVDDLASAAQHWASTTGAGPFFVAAHHRADRFLYRGEPIEADVSYAFGYSGAMQIQLVVQHDELPSIYREVFPSGGGGFHHMASLVVDYDGARRRLLDQGHQLALRARRERHPRVLLRLPSDARWLRRAALAHRSHRGDVREVAAGTRGVGRPGRPAAPPHERHVGTQP